jgi:hypothetical protein
MVVFRAGRYSLYNFEIYIKLYIEWLSPYFLYPAYGVFSIIFYWINKDLKYRQKTLNFTNYHFIVFPDEKCYIIVVIVSTPARILTNKAQRNQLTLMDNSDGLSASVRGCSANEVFVFHFRQFICSPHASLRIHYTRQCHVTLTCPAAFTLIDAGPFPDVGPCSPLLLRERGKIKKLLYFTHRFFCDV